MPASLTLDTNMNNNNNTVNNNNNNCNNNNNNIDNNNDNHNNNSNNNSINHHHNNNNNNRYNVTSAEQPPPIYITSHDTLPKTESLYVPSNQGYNSSPSSPQLSPANSPIMNNHNQNNNCNASRPTLTVQTHNLQQQIPSSPSSPIGNIDLSQPPLSPASSINSYNAAINTPLPPSPNTFFSDDDPALYSHPHSPHASFMLDHPAIHSDSNLNQHHHHHHHHNQQQQQQQQAMINQNFQSVRF